MTSEKTRDMGALEATRIFYKRKTMPFGRTQMHVTSDEVMEYIEVLLIYDADMVVNGKDTDYVTVSGVVVCNDTDGVPWTLGQVRAAWPKLFSEAAMKREFEKDAGIVPGQTQIDGLGVVRVCKDCGLLFSVDPWPYEVVPVKCSWCSKSPADPESRTIAEQELALLGAVVEWVRRIKTEWIRSLLVDTTSICKSDNTLIFSNRVESLRRLASSVAEMSGEEYALILAESVALLTALRKVADVVPRADKAEKEG